MKRTTKSYGRAAAWTAAVILGVVAGFQFYWSLGGTWGLHEASGGAAPPMSASEQIGAAIIGLIALAAAGVLLVRVGYWREHVPFAVARIGAWVIAIAALGGALGYFGAHTDFERFVFGGAT